MSCKAGLKAPSGTEIGDTGYLLCRWGKRERVMLAERISDETQSPIVYVLGSSFSRLWLDRPRGVARSSGGAILVSLTFVKRKNVVASEIYQNPRAQLPAAQLYF
jgi:hypothetical protein